MEHKRQNEITMTNSAILQTLYCMWNDVERGKKIETLKRTMEPKKKNNAEKKTVIHFKYVICNKNS